MKEILWCDKYQEQVYVSVCLKRQAGRKKKCKKCKTGKEVKNGTD